MTDLIALLKSDLDKLSQDLKEKRIINNFNLENISIDYSSKSKQGDLSTNIFLLLLKNQVDKNFLLKAYISNYFFSLNYIENIEIVKAGFINIFINKNFLISKLKYLFFDKNQFIKKQKKINIEFVSANPTGPIHVAHMRGAVLGDVLASILEFLGHKVTREYYINDAGSQIKTLGDSLYKRYQQLFNIDVNILDSEYPGEYLINIAKKIKNVDDDKWLNVKDQKTLKNYFESYAVNFLIEDIKNDLSLLNIKFDKFTYESKIVKNNYIHKVFTLLKEKNLIYEGFLSKPLGEEDQYWEPRKQLLFRSSNFSDDTDRPFKKVNGDWTYFANDTAYHYEKSIRGFDKLINIWGADHIGYIARMKSIVDVISNKKNYLDVHICQIVRLIKNGKILKMSKREGNFISLRKIYNEVGKDALRYFMISSKNETLMDFDMNKVIEKNKDNPVFYCQYAYARASSVIRKSKEFKNIPNLNNSFDLFNINSVSKYEWEIILKLLFWPHILKQAAQTSQPHRIIIYLEDLCSHFHSFWNKGKHNTSLRMINENDLNQTVTKLIWIQSFRIILKEIFTIIGIDSPEVM